MHRLWAPWRMEYIAASVEPQKADETCVFCDMLNPGDDRSRLLLHKKKHTMVVINRFPYNNGHLLIMPKAHVGHYDELDQTTFRELHDLLHETTNVVQKAFHPDGMNIGLNFGRVAGAGIPGHMHYHLVPRWNGDTNFMAVTGLAKVISQHLLETYDQLKPLFAT